ncbi:MAG: glutamate racemase [Clostridia bacterium]|nr:glutamate racemase [Clostridia bacterium]
MDKRPIGVFDSGLGGLTAVRRLQELLPGEDIVYFGDTGRVPYGTRSRDTILRYADEDCRLLLAHDVKFIIAACGTVSSVAQNILANLPVPAIGVVEPTAAEAAAATKNGKIGIIGTAATVRSASFEKALLAINPALQITATPCPMFVPLVENGWISPEDEVATLTVRRYLATIKAAGVDTLILGCTHFPLLAPIIAQELGSGVTLIDSGYETARLCVRLLDETEKLSPNKIGSSRYYVSDQPEGFSQVAEIFLGHSVKQEVEMVHPTAK